MTSQNRRHPRLVATLAAFLLSIAIIAMPAAMINVPRTVTVAVALDKTSVNPTVKRTPTVRDRDVDDDISDWDDMSTTEKTLSVVTALLIIVLSIASMYVFTRGNRRS